MPNFGGGRASRSHCICWHRIGGCLSNKLLAPAVMLASFTKTYLGIVIEHTWRVVADIVDVIYTANVLNTVVETPCVLHEGCGRVRAQAV